MLFEIVRRRKIWYVISLLVLIPGLISLFVQGLNLGIDFTGGNIFEVRFNKQVTVNELRNALSEYELQDSVIQQSGGNDYIIRTKELSLAESGKVVSGLKSKLGELTVMKNDQVGPTIGKELTRNALLALLVAFMLMLGYISWRFEFKQGVAALLALIHDVFVVTGIFSLFQLEVDSYFVAAILTIIGYSINDTIVIFDRIRENMLSRKKGQSLEELVNSSLWQTMARSINTVMTVIFVLLALFFLGGSTIKIFVLALLIGVFSGCYSSIFNASQIWVDLKLMEGNKKKAAA
ncbi:protein-export membrane protein SecF [Desulfofarcimen acetoxidans DSM 771]|uniref:Protein-export membrane protein SecF n=1 Tax=Desulfofarcimen acetoxidans (strain ATCC 49208 / DSM 771 / KCTC 5769 / VKM B-1644 / 5575) TaxID=485916 RepID=C8W4E2_DESAS|nr:protein-export membrane protein SecF [Desulfofarcimen acetoxidans DSM 771]